MNFPLHHLTPADLADTLALRGDTAQNAISEARLRELGITVETLTEGLTSTQLQGWCTRDDTNGQMTGFCFVDIKQGEVTVVAVRRGFEGQGIGKRLLACGVQALREAGAARIWLWADATPGHRAMPFYLSQGWRLTGKALANGDVEMELIDAR